MFGKRKQRSRGSADGERESMDLADVADVAPDGDAPEAGRPVRRARGRHSSGHESAAFVKTTQGLSENAAADGGMAAAAASAVAASASASPASPASPASTTATATATATTGFAGTDFVPEPFDELVDVTDLRQRYRKLRRSMWTLRVISILLLVLAACVIGYPLALQYQSSQRLAETSDTAAQTVAGWPYPEAENALAAARAYNERLAQSGQPILGEASDPFSNDSGGSHASGEDSASANDEEYQSLLDAGGGVMGTIRVPKVSIELPIYHGTSESALASGAGHLYGSSLPVGGESTHSVITGHRGLVEAMMFTRLDEMEVGDIFYIEVMGETLAYTVDRITVIEPTDTSQLKIVPGEDRVTLMTCTPYGVNTHRLLVSGVRAAMPDPAPYLDDAPGDARTAAIIAAGATLAVGWLLVSWWRRSPWKIMRHGTTWPRHW